MVYHRKGAPGGWWTRRFRVDHEYLLIFLKGRKPAYFDKEALKVPSKHAGITRKGGKRMTDGTTTPYEMDIKDTKCRGTVWTYSAIRDNNGLRKEHPASMPIGLAVDFIHAFTPPTASSWIPCPDREPPSWQPPPWLAITSVSS